MNRTPSFSVLLFFGIWVGLWLPIAIPLAIWLKWRPLQPIAPTQKLPLLASLYLLAPLVLWQFTRWQHQTLAELGFLWQRSLFSSFLWGISVGSLGLLGMFGVERGFGWLRWQGSADSPASDQGAAAKPTAIWRVMPVIFSTLLLSIWVSGTEELIFRGFILTQFQHSHTVWMAAVLTSGIFALLHLVWEGRDNIPQLPGLWLMGMVLAIARWVDGGNLGLAWGLHAGWVWAIASLDTLEAIHYTGQAPEWLTGLAGKPLAGGIGILFLLLTGLLISASAS